MDPATFFALEPTGQGRCKHCGEAISRYETDRSQLWYHDTPEGLRALPRRGCDAASWDRHYAEGRPSWDGYPKHLKATPA